MENKVEVRHLEPHETFQGNGTDTYWYQFSVSESLKGLPQGLLENAIALAIDTVKSVKPLPGPNIPPSTGEQ